MTCFLMDGKDSQVEGWGMGHGVAWYFLPFSSASMVFVSSLLQLDKEKILVPLNPLACLLLSWLQSHSDYLYVLSEYKYKACVQNVTSGDVIPDLRLRLICKAIADKMLVPWYFRFRKVLLKTSPPRSLCA